jgi:FMN phosphatase YigB (HAD superfamily)
VQIIIPMSGFGDRFRRAGYRASFQHVLEKMRPEEGCIWMIGDNSVNDIGGAREHIKATTIQKFHKGMTLGAESNAPDAIFVEYSRLRRFLRGLSVSGG